MSIGTLDSADKSIGRSIGINNLSFWKPTAKVLLPWGKLYKILHINLLWITLEIQSPASYHMNAALSIRIEQLTKKEGEQ